MGTCITASATHFMHNLFAPLPERAVPNELRKDGIDMIADYTDSSAGALDFFRIVEHALAYFKRLPWISEAQELTTGKVSEVISLSGTALSLPQIVSDLNALRKSVEQFFKVQDLPYSDSFRQQRIVQAVKKVFISMTNMAFTATQSLIFFHEVKLVDLAKNMPLVSFVNNGTSLISDTAELFEEVYKIKDYKEQQAAARSPREASEWEDKSWLSGIKIVKDTASIILATIALAGIVCGVAMTSITIVTTATLLLSTVWLATKISSYFYEKVITERHNAARLAV